MFSGAVKIGDLNDFIAPSQACVVNLEGGKLIATADAEVGAVQLQQRATTSFSQTLPAAPDQPVKVSLHDCLACSGCVTSAETVLLQHQSTAELLQRLADPTWTVVVSLSPQSVAALAALHGVTADACAAKLASFLRRLGAAAVFDVAAARQLALAEAAAEFVQRYRSSARGQAALAAAAAAGNASAAAALEQLSFAPQAGPAGECMEVEGGTEHGQQSGTGGLSRSSDNSGQKAAGPLPMLASACPGWVCYAEKTHGEHALPHIATGKSPQAVLGTLVKRRWCSSSGLPPAAVYHVAVMPCYDKKLEASREDFWLPGTQVPETDSVLATTELQELLQERGVELASVVGQPLDCILPPFPAAVGGNSATSGAAAGAADCAPGCAAAEQGAAGQQDSQQLPAVNGRSTAPHTGSLPAGAAAQGGTLPCSSGSGGYLEHVFRVAAEQLFGVQLPPGPLQMRVGRNADMREVALELPGSCGTVLRFAAAYGFRNIQGLMRKVKLGRSEFDYVEVMACPSGCLNGGGQPKPRPGQTTAQLLEQLEMLIGGSVVTSSSSSSSAGALVPESNPAVQQLYSEWVRDGPGSAAARQLLHTQYHKRDKTVTATLADW